MVVNMPANFIELDSLDRLDRLFHESYERPVLLFKHSSNCGISAGVYHEVAHVTGDVNVVVIQTHRDISNAIASRTGVRHESPQAIVLRHGQPVYSASHFDIEAAHIESSFDVSEKEEC